jgi:hypothetical protein
VIELERPTTMPTWFDFETPTTLAIDIRAPGGRVLHRFRTAPTVPAPDDGLSIKFEPAKAAYLKFDGIDGESIDPAPIAAMVMTNFPTFEADAYAAAMRHLEAFAALAPTGSPTMAEVRGYWSTDRDTIIAELVAPVAHAAAIEGMLCQAALPATLALAKQLDTGTMPADASGAVVSTFEAVRGAGTPSANASAGGTLTLSSGSGLTVTPLDVSASCRAVAEIGAFADVLAPFDRTRANLIGSAAAIDLSPRTLDRALAEWVSLLDALLAGTTSDEDAALTAARAKADILIEWMGAHHDAAAARFDLAHALVQL